MSLEDLMRGAGEPVTRAEIETLQAARKRGWSYPPSPWQPETALDFALCILETPGVTPEYNDEGLLVAYRGIRLKQK